MSKPCKSIRAALAVACAIGVGSVLADEAPAANATSIHGFAMAGFIATDGNNFYGKTRHGGDFAYYEAGINAYRPLTPGISVAGQLLSRKAGATDDGDVRIDYAFVDLHFSPSGNDTLGVRAGRVRNPLGFYNESRDVIFTRPSVLLPQSTYFEGTGVREMLFSSDGVQFFGSVDSDDARTELKVSVIPSKEASDRTIENFLAGTPPGSSLAMTVKHPLFAQLLHERDGGRQRFALSYIDITLDGTYTIGRPFGFVLASKLYTLSAQYNAEAWSLTSEYRLTDTQTSFAGSETKSSSDGIYLQYQYHFSPLWTGLARLDFSYPKRSDRSNNVASDTTLGASWRPARNWQLNAEYHYIDGRSGIPRPDNPDGISQRTNLLALTAGYRF